MGSKVNRVGNAQGDNVVRGAFLAPPASAKVPPKELPNRQEVRDNLKRGANQLPSGECTQQSILDSCMHFANDVGLNPNADVDHKTKTITNSVVLRQQIASLRDELAGQLGELRQRSNKYIHVAESAGHWITDAEQFVDRHPNLLWFLSRRK
jgi:hypothetical protein